MKALTNQESDPLPPHVEDPNSSPLRPLSLPPTADPNSDIDSDYVHVTDTMALDAGAGGHLSPFVHVKKAPAVVPDGGSPSSSAADMDIEADEEVWSESAAPPPSAASVSVIGGGGATGAGVRAKSGTTAAAGNAGARGLDGEGRPLGEGKGQKERLPYIVLVLSLIHI